MIDPTPPLKRCLRCNEDKPLQQFSKDKNRKDGLVIYCKACCAARRMENIEAIKAHKRDYYQENAEKIKAHVRDYRLANPDIIRERKRLYHYANRDRILSKQQAYREANRPLIRQRARLNYAEKREMFMQRMRNYYKANIEKFRDYSREYYIQNGEAVRERVKKYHAANPDIYRAIYHKRRARLNSNGGTFTHQELTAMRQAQAGICAYCFQQHEPHGLTIDHIIPIKQGGRHEAANICLACPRCNRQKHNRTPEQWVKRWYHRKDA